MHPILRRFAACGPRASALFAAGLAILTGCAGLDRSASLEPPTWGHRVADGAADRSGRQASAARGVVPREGDRSFLLGVGFTGSPGTALVAGQVDFYLTDEWAVGPLLQLGLSSDDAIVAPSFNVKRVFPTQTFRDTPWRPFAQAGAGFAYLYHDRRFGHGDDTGFLLNGGGGVEVFLDDDLSLASTLMVNILPDEVLGERAFLSWQIVQMQFRF